MHASQPDIARPALASIALWGTGIYVLAQVLTGIEVGSFAAWLVVRHDWALAEALASSMPFGLPLVAAQAAVLSLLAHRWLR